MGSTITPHKSRGRTKLRQPTQEEMLFALSKAEVRVIATHLIDEASTKLTPLSLLNELAANAYVVLAERIPALVPPSPQILALLAGCAMEHHQFSPHFSTKEEIIADAERILQQKEQAR